MSDYALREVMAHEVLPLRARVLRQGLPFESAPYDADEHPEARHFAAINRDARTIGVLSLFREAFDPKLSELAPDHASDNHFRLRGVAVDPQARGAGIGRALIAAAGLHALAQGGRSLWCTVRTPVVGFWEGAGFAILGEEFEMPPNGPHYFALRPLTSANSDQPWWQRR